MISKQQKIFLAFLFLIYLSQAQTQEMPGCINHKGEVVDWFLLYYTPYRMHSFAPLYGYMYKDSNSETEEFDIYKGWGDDEKGPLGKTIAQANQRKLESIAWNDELYPHQGSGTSNKAQSKFFMSLEDKSNGFAIIHSLPKFPTINEDG